MIDQYFQTPNNMPRGVKQRIYAINIFYNDYVMRWSTAKISFVNIPKNMYLSKKLLEQIQLYILR